MGRAFRPVTYLTITTLVLLASSVLFCTRALSQQLPPCGEEVLTPAPESCPPGIPLDHGSFQAAPLMDGVGQPYPQVNGALHVEKVALYGQYGNSENSPPFPEAQAHYSQGLFRASLVQPLATSGTSDPSGAIVVLFVGFSNCEIEICGGSSDAWDGLVPPQSRFVGQPCATGATCPNPRYGDTSNSWNRADRLTQESLLWQAYSPDNGGPLVGAHVYLFNGATGHQPLPNWDPFSSSNANCPECNYQAVHTLLTNNGFSENQVQVLLLYASTSFPQCDLSGFHCVNPGTDVPDAYQSEQYMGEIMRYLKQGYNGHPARYPNLRQVFIMSRNYGGYAQNAPAPGDPFQGCLNPEPFAYEEGFSIQRLAVAQIRQAYGLTSSDSYSGPVTYDATPWFDWGPYLWASGKTRRSDGLAWCDNDTDPLSPCFAVRDFRWGDESTYYGDLTHPALSGQQKAAAQVLNFLLTSPFTQSWIQH